MKGKKYVQTLTSTESILVCCPCFLSCRCGSIHGISTFSVRLGILAGGDIGGMVAACHPVE